MSMSTTHLPKNLRVSVGHISFESHISFKNLGTRGNGPCIKQHALQKRQLFFSGFLDGRNQTSVFNLAKEKKRNFKRHFASSDKHP